MPNSHPFANRRIAKRTLAACLKARNPKIREAAMYTLAMGRLHDPFVHQVGRLALDKKQPEPIRIWAIQSLGRTQPSRALPYLRRIVHDVTDDTCRRSDALEQMSTFQQKHLVDEFITLLSDKSADIRFWAVFCLSQCRVDITHVLSKLDQMVAYDHAVPQCYGWHVDREALEPYETIWFSQIFPQALSLEHDNHGYSPQLILISAAPEYGTFSHQYQSWLPNGKREITPTFPITLNIDAAWLSKRIKAQWPNAELNVRHPHPAAYQFDFKLTRGEERLMGGLHRDGYALVLTGDVQINTDFATWYRTIIDTSQPLFVYEWANDGKLLK